MNFTKDKLQSFINDLPDNVNLEEVCDRLYLLQKIESGEAAIKEGKTLSHDEAMKRLSKKWQN